MIAVLDCQIQFYKDFLMARSSFDPRDFGISMNKDDFVDRMCELFQEQYQGAWTIDELLLHPREASRFCDDVRRRIASFDVPDDIILRVIMARRKNPIV